MFVDVKRVVPSLLSFGDVELGHGILDKHVISRAIVEPTIM